MCRLPLRARAPAQPLEGVRDHFNIFTNLSHLEADSKGDGSGDHNRAAGAWLTGVHAYDRTRPGAEIRLAHPNGYAPDPRIVAAAEDRAAETGGRLVFGQDPQELVAGADIVYTDAWTSMGQEVETESRRDAFALYRVDDALMDAAGPDAMAMHCLPAHRGEEITSSVMDGPRSLIFEQSENRLHVQKALLVELIGSA